MTRLMIRRWAIVLLAPMLASGCVWVARVSVDTQGQGANDFSRDPHISADGRYVAFQSFAADLVANDNNGVSDVFRRDLQTGTTELASIDGITVGTYAGSDGPGISADGRYVLFRSIGANVPPAGDSRQGLFVRDMQTDTTERVDVTPFGGEPDPAGESIVASLSSDGRFVAFYSTAEDLVNDDDNNLSDVFVRDLLNDTTTRVSVDANGDDANGISEFDTGDPPAISSDGRYIAFNSFATDLTGSPDGNGTGDVFVRDTQVGSTIRASVDATGGDANDFSSEPSLSGDGRTLAFTSSASDLTTTPDGTEGDDVYVRDLDAGTTVRASVDASGGDASDQSTQPSLSSDAKFVAFTSNADDLVPVDSNMLNDVFVRDLEAERTKRASASPLGGNANGASDQPDLTDDARFVALASSATNIAGPNGDSFADIFVRAVRVPEVDTVSPLSIARGSTETFLLTGANFTPDATVGARTSEGTGGISVDSVNVISDSQLEVSITVAPGAPTGTLFVTVNIPGPGPGWISFSAGTCQVCPEIS